MGSVGSSSAVDCSLGYDVSDDALLWVEGLSQSIGLKVGEEADDVLD